MDDNEFDPVSNCRTNEDAEVISFLFRWKTTAGENELDMQGAMNAAAAKFADTVKPELRSKVNWTLLDSNSITPPTGYGYIGFTAPKA